jgi:predicted acyltransferase (DUF342 family)
MTSWAPLALTTLTAALLVLPVTPALYELWKRNDAAPLPTSRHDGRIANFAEALRLRVEPLRLQLEQCRTERVTSRVSLEGMEVLLVGCNADDFDFDPRLTNGIAALMFSEAARVPAGSVVEADIHADGYVALGEGATLRAARSGTDILLEKDSMVLRWLHADRVIHLCEGSTAYGRVSSGQSIRLERGSGFQHMHSPQIVTLDADKSEDDQYLPAHICPTDSVLNAGDVLMSSRPRMRIQGDYVLAAGETLNANVIVTGELRIGAGARLFGSAKSYKDTTLEEDACVHGSIVCGQTIRLGPRCFVAGPVLAEGDVMIARGSRVGESDALTTISSCGAQIAVGCQLHGTIWARVQGNVEG